MKNGRGGGPLLCINELFKIDGCGYLPRHKERHTSAQTSCANKKRAFCADWQEEGGWLRTDARDVYNLVFFSSASIYLGTMASTPDGGAVCWPRGDGVRAPTTTRLFTQQLRPWRCKSYSSKKKKKAPRPVRDSAFTSQNVMKSTQWEG